MAEWMPVYGSSHVAAIRYHEGSRECYVRFSNGVVYRYDNVSPAEWDEFVHSASKGKFVNLVLRRGHTYERIEEPEDKDGN